jgi:hypothetical protein
MDFVKIMALMTVINSPVFGETGVVEKPKDIILAQASAFNCGLKPLPQLGYEIGRCINGRWEQVSKRASSPLNCGHKPLPQLGYEIGRCINGQWEQISKRTNSSLNCGLKPHPRLGYRIGRCINGQWEQVSR